MKGFKRKNIHEDNTILNTHMTQTCNFIKKKESGTGVFLLIL